MSVLQKCRIILCAALRHDTLLKGPLIFHSGERRSNLIRCQGVEKLQSLAIFGCRSTDMSACESAVKKTKKVPNLFLVSTAYSFSMCSVCTEPNTAPTPAAVAGRTRCAFKTALLTRGRRRRRHRGQGEMRLTKRLPAAAAAREWERQMSKDAPSGSLLVRRNKMFLVS